MAGPPGKPPSTWKTWHKVTLGILGVMILCLCGVAVFAPGDDPGDKRETTTKPEVAALAGSAAPASSSPAAADPAPSRTPTASSKPTPTKKASAKPVYYASCAAVEAAGKAPLSQGQPGYRRALDRDGDGVACEPNGDDDPPPADDPPTDDPPSDDEPTGGTDPRFSSCAKANAAGYGPYYRGVDPEYDWYRDRDNDGVVCES